MMCRRRYGIAAFVAILLLSPGQAGQAHASLFAITTIGDRIAHVGDGGHEAWRLHGSQQVGYKYRRCAFFWLDLWTWGGTYCVYEELTQKYKPIDTAEAARLLGKNVSELETPSGYRFPRG
jgi:hypothetical protein